MKEREEERLKILKEYENKLYENGLKYIAGIDEVGRGPLAGPVVTASVIMPYNEMIDGVFDSKKVTKKNRERLYNIILSKAISISIALKDQDTIDEINILNATKQAMIESYNNLTIKPDILLLDAVKLNVAENEMSIINFRFPNVAKTLSFSSFQKRWFLC